MRHCFDIPKELVFPTESSLLARQMVPEGTIPDKRMKQLVADTLSIFDKLVQPKGIIAAISREEFEVVLAGEGKNHERAVIYDVFPFARELALFAVTVGDNVCHEIVRLFEANEFPLASMLDAAASESAEMAVTVAEQRFNKHLEETSKTEKGLHLMPFSPGYCGWDVSGQKNLFEFLKPEEIGIRLTDSYLMQPLKSVSGVIVLAETGIFDIDNSYPYCAQCTTDSCRERYERISRP